MANDEKPGDVLEDLDLWILQYRAEGSNGWVDVGTDRASAADSLRTYDFWKENYPDVEPRLLKTTVRRMVEDPEKLREMLPQEPVESGDPDLQSE